ncbi:MULTISPECIES: reverse transcriptase family protein [Aeromonas]|uniref:reverse transcriptase family protein n=1 Tax=Aeromonas TaxID=642 RepID=UPI0018A788A0|nr:reverse transcriptase family protein [Aeromonas dhakensis]MBF8448537.1 RNA-directed DNA polymerase [Aeromonas dhakensis]
MKKYTINASILSTLEGCSFFFKGKGAEPLPFSHVKEGKLGNKFIYKVSGSEARQINLIHESLISTLFEKLPVNQSATAYLKGKSYLDFLEPHRNNHYFLRVDLRNFFHFIDKEMVLEALHHHVSEDKITDECNQSSLELVSRLVTLKLPNESANSDFTGKSILPIGFKTSPVVSNVVFRKFDILIEKFCAQHDILYTRYADDMLFSASDIRTSQYKERDLIFDLVNPRVKKKKPFLHSHRFIEQISFIVNLGGFKLNAKKTKMGEGNFTINGYTISGTNYSYKSGAIRVSNKKTKIISKLLHECNTKDDDGSILNAVFNYRVAKIKLPYKPSMKFLKVYYTSQLNNKLIGYKSYLISLLKFNEHYRCMDPAFITKCEKLVSGLNEMIIRRMK